MDQDNRNLVKFSKEKRKILLWTGRAPASFGAGSAWPGAALQEGSWGRERSGLTVPRPHRGCYKGGQGPGGQGGDQPQCFLAHIQVLHPVWGSAVQGRHQEPGVWSGMSLERRGLEQLPREERPQEGLVSPGHGDFRELRAATSSAGRGKREPGSVW